MKTRFPSLTGSSTAGEGAAMNSQFSTERSPKTALLFEASRTVLLPVVRATGDASAVRIVRETGDQSGHSVQE